MKTVVAFVLALVIVVAIVVIAVNQVNQKESKVNPAHIAEFDAVPQEFLVVTDYYEGKPYIVGYNFVAGDYCLYTGYKTLYAKDQGLKPPKVNRKMLGSFELFLQEARKAEEKKQEIHFVVLLQFQEDGFHLYDESNRKVADLLKAVISGREFVIKY